jgi:hypothetical protein
MFPDAPPSVLPLLRLCSIVSTKLGSEKGVELRRTPMPIPQPNNKSNNQPHNAQHNNDSNNQ